MFLLTCLFILLFSFSFNKTLKLENINLITIKYYYHEKKINENIYNLSEINKLINIFSVKYFKDNPSCGFSEDISFEFISNNSKLTFCPALDGCPIIKILEKNVYILIENNQQKVMDDILKNYGFIFPAL